MCSGTEWLEVPWIVLCEHTVSKMQSPHSTSNGSRYILQVNTNPKSLNLMAFWYSQFVQCGNLYYINLDVKSACIHKRVSYLFIDGGTANRNADVVTLNSLCGLQAALYGNIIFKSMVVVFVYCHFSRWDEAAFYMFVYLGLWTCLRLSLPSIKCAVAIEALHVMP